MLGPWRTVQGLAAILAVSVHLGGQESAAPRPVALDPQSLGLSDRSADQLHRAIQAHAWREAEELLFRAASERPADARLLRALGIAHYQAGRPYAAAATLRRADALEPLDADARFLLTSAFIRLRRSHWARPELERLIAATERDGRYRYTLARIYYDQQRFDEAVGELRVALAGQPQDPAALDLLGQCLEGLARTAEAAAAYGAAVAAMDGGAARSAWPHFHLGSLHHDLGDMAEAERALRQAVQADPGHAAAHRELGLVLQKLNRPAAAAEMLERAARLDARNAKVHYSLSLVYGQLGDTERANRALERFRSLSDSGRF